MINLYIDKNGLVVKRKPSIVGCNIAIEEGRKSIPVGSMVNNIDFIDNNNGYETRSKITSILEKHSKLDEGIYSIYDGENLKISSSYRGIDTVGNEISIFLLLKYGIITLHASSILCNDIAVLMCGKSNSGKSTMAMDVVQKNSKALQISDDHVHIVRIDENFYITPPIWDLKYSINNKWYKCRELNIFKLDSHDEKFDIIDLLKSIVLFSYMPCTDELILDSLSRWLSEENNIIMYSGRYKDWEYNSKILENIIGNLIR